jgi:hypothetical protein
MRERERMVALAMRAVSIYVILNLHFYYQPDAEVDNL